MDWLTKRYDADQKTIELIMTADKQAQQQWFRDLEHQGVDVLILDRYTTSQLAYSQANGIDDDWTIILQAHLRNPDIEILIDIPAEVSMSRKGKHNDGNNDRYESDREMLDRVRTNYLTHFESMQELDIPVIVADGLKSIEQIHEDIYEFIANELMIKGESLV